jgi:uncharacterized protein (TIGR02145 family)
MEQNILSDIERLKHDYADLKAEIHELSNAFNQAQVSNSRKRGVYTSAGATCEAILKFIYQKDSTNQKPANKMMLDELLIKVADELPVQVMINFRTIQAWRNLGTHDKDDMRNIDSNSLIMVDMALSNIVNWFFSSYLNIEVPGSKTNKIGKKEEASITSKPKTKSEVKSAPALKAKKPSTEKKTTSIQVKQVTKKQLEKKESTLRDVPNLKSIKPNLQKVQTRIETYPEIKIGNQIWMQENLNIETFSNGDSILHAKTKGAWIKAGETQTPAWCYYENEEDNEFKFGKLYNNFAVQDKRGLAPVGWKIPSRRDFEELLSNLKKNKYNSIEKGGLIIYTDFKIILAGKRTQTGNFTGETDETYFWGGMYADFHGRLSLGGGDYNYGCYIRCIKIEQ